MKFCFLCGKKSEKLIEGYCEECYNKQFQLIEVPKEIDVTLCSKCGLVKERNKWKDIGIEDFIKNKIKIIGKDVEIRIERNDTFEIHAKGYLNNSKKLKEEVQEIVVNENKIVCPNCFKRFGGYSEAILQLRGNITNEILNFVDDQIVSDFLKNKKIFYRIKEVKGGFDLYINNKSLARKIAIILKNKYKAEVKKSFKLVTRKQGRDIYKNIILIRI